MTDDLLVRRKRAAYRCQHRGTKEMDWLMSRFAAARLDQMSAEDLAVFEAFLLLPDPDLQHWIMDVDSTPDPAFARLVGDIRAFHGVATVRP